MLSLKRNKYLNGLIQDRKILTLDEIGVERGMGLLEDHFSQIKGDIVEFERDVSPLNFLKNWKVSDRSPLSKGRVELMESDSTMYLIFDTHSHSGGFKYFNPNTQFAFLEDSFYIGLVRKVDNNKVKIYHENLYVPQKRIDNLK